MYAVQFKTLMSAAVLVAFSSANAATFTSTTWKYDFNHLNLTTGAAGSTESQASDFETQSSTTSSIAPGGNEGWALSFSSTGLTKGTVYQYGASEKGMSNQWYRTSAENYFLGRIGFANQGTPVGNLKSITNMQTTTDVLRYYWTGISGSQVTSPSGQGIQWQIKLEQDATPRITIGPPWAAASTGGSTTTWFYYTPASPGGVNTGIAYTPLSATQIELLVDPVTNQGTFNLNGSNVFTNLDLVGASGVSLRNLNNFSLQTKGGTSVSFGVEPVVVPEPSSLLAVGGVGVCGVALRHLRRRK